MSAASHCHAYLSAKCDKVPQNSRVLVRQVANCFVVFYYLNGKFVQLKWNFKLCCFYFFPNSAIRNRGCGLSMDAAYTRMFTVIVLKHAYAVRVQNYNTKPCFCRIVFQHVRTLTYFMWENNSFYFYCFENLLMQFCTGLPIESGAWWWNKISRNHA